MTSDHAPGYPPMLTDTHMYDAVFDAKKQCKSKKDGYCIDSCVLSRNTDKVMQPDFFR